MTGGRSVLALLAIIVACVVLLLLVFGYREDRCEGAGGSLVVTGGSSAICVDADGRIIND